MGGARDARRRGSCQGAGDECDGIENAGGRAWFGGECTSESAGERETKRPGGDGKQALVTRKAVSGVYLLGIPTQYTP